MADGNAPAKPSPPMPTFDPVPPPPKAEAAPPPEAAAPSEPEPEPEPHHEEEVHEAVPAVPATTNQPPAVRAQTTPAAGAGLGEPPKESAVAAQTIRVNVELLENLMTLVSELVLTRNQLLQMVRGRDDSEFTAPLQRLSHITTDLQEGVMKTRMQPIGNAWAKLPRIVRDLSVEMHKKIDLQMLGAETELDRQVLELIKDPLTHMVRNSADHGLEGPEERKLAGKPEVGKIVLNAYHEGGHIIIEISDDGRGLNVDRIKTKALQNGLATESELEGMTPQQIYQFIFKAGFSTAEKVTSVSGRGVGMDVVRTNIERIGGTVELKSQPGKGSTFVIKIPLTLAIVSALIVECASERFAIPQISVLELVRVTQSSENGIETINNAPVLRLRDRLLPLVSLKNLLRLPGETVSERRETFIVVTQVGTYTFGIIVDRVFDTEEIVVKPVAPILRHITMFSGNTILGDGSVIMILDPNGIAGSTGESGMMAGAQATETHMVREGHGDDKTSLLVFRAGGDDLKAVPLALVARLEEIDVKEVEVSHGKPMVQYRGHLMPLIGVDGSLTLRDEGRQPVLVFSDREHTMGLVVDEIVDIVEDRMRVELSTDMPGIIGTAVVAGRATTIVDAGYYLPQAFGDWFGSTKEFGGTDEQAAARILLVDDSPFFRNLLTPLLSVAGYEVVAVESADRALNLREQGSEFDMIISDIEMPGMSGFDFAAAVRADGRWQATPMVALSSHATDKDFERGRSVGFNDYVAKFDRDSLLSTIAQTIATIKGAA
jgi:two-component system chemotaxis sensor kinase CheA